MRARLALVVVLVAVMSGIAAAPIGHGAGADKSAPWAGNPLASVVYAQSQPAQEPAAPVPSVPEPELAAEPEEVQPIEPADQAEEEQAPAPEPEPEPEPAPATLSDVYSALIAAETAQASNQVTVDAASETLEAARQALVDAETAHASAMEGQGERNAGVRAAAQALVDYLTATYLQ